MNSAATTTTITWTDEQERIFTHCLSPSPTNLLVRARAGTGKSTTLVELVHRLRRKDAGTSILYCAFNKDLQLSLQLNLKGVPKVRVKTLHSIGYGTLRYKYKGIQVDQKKTGDYARQVLFDAGRFNGAGDRKYPYRGEIGTIKSLMSWARSTLQFDLSELAQVALRKGWCSEAENAQLFAGLAITAVEQSIQDTTRCDFDEMIYMPYRHEIKPWGNDVVLIDETQDLNASQIWLAKNSAKKGGLIVAVGDDRQAIYGFRGAAYGAVDRVKEELRAAELSLTLTYRCPQQVVDLARDIVPDYQTAKPATGEVQYIGATEVTYVPGSYVLSRTNAPLIRVALSCLRDGISATVAGRSIGEGIKKLINSYKASTVEALLSSVEQWRQKQLKALAIAAQASGDEPNKDAVEEIDDMAETIAVLSIGCTSVDAVHTRIDQLFTDVPKSRQVVCSTVHRAKGGERDVVYVLAKTFRHNGFEEENLWYVAITRAKEQLLIITESGDEEE